MKITAKTKISAIIKNDPHAIDVIASINKHFRKLKNPILSKLLASRVSVADAAKIGGITTKTFLNTLKTHGYEVELPQIDQEDNHSNQHITKMNKDNILELDVRPILAGGVDPFEEIMKTLKTMPDDQTLLIINTFEPVPLLNILEKRGYEYETERPEPGLIHCYLHKSGKAPIESPTATATPPADSFEKVENLFKGKMKEIDVRDMEMPMPMVTILEELEKLTDGNALFVHHKRLPQYLLPELENRSFQLVHKVIDENNLNLIIFK